MHFSWPFQLLLRLIFMRFYEKLQLLQFQTRSFCYYYFSRNSGRAIKLELK